jgi:hypothetical protein
LKSLEASDSLILGCACKTRRAATQHKTAKMKMLFPCVVLYQESSFLADPSSCRISLERERERES